MKSVQRCCRAFHSSHQAGSFLVRLRHMEVYRAGRRVTSELLPRCSCQKQGEHTRGCGILSTDCQFKGSLSIGEEASRSLVVLTEGAH
jgi:hypothetical protein